MTAKTHKVATDALETLGMLIPENSGRDAIHLAVEPVVAGEHLYPGQRIKLLNGRAIAAANAEAIGIVDPFLALPVFPDQRFWLVVLPRTITSLRHVWSHPAFPEEKQFHAEADEHYVSDKAVSEAWLKNFSERLFSYDPPEEYGTRLEQLIAGIEHGGSFGTDIEYSDDVQPSAELYRHYERFTGKPAPKQAAYFRCAC